MNHLNPIHAVQTDNMSHACHKAREEDSVPLRTLSDGCTERVNPSTEACPEVEEIEFKTEQ